MHMPMESWIQLLCLCRFRNIFTWLVKSKLVKQEVSHRHSDTSPYEESECWVGARVKWLWEMTHVREVVGSNPGVVYWMDMKFFHKAML